MVIIIACIAILTILIVGCSSWVIAKKQRSKLKPTTDEEMSIKHGNENIKHENASMDLLSANQNRLRKAIGTRDWTASLEAKLGEGNFGIVYMATMTQNRKSKKVAIKQVKNIENQAHIISLRTELGLMNTLKSKPHENLVTLIDHVQLEGDATWLIMEYCNLGQLKEFLWKNEKALLSEADVGVINSKSLCIWAREISRGMAHLEKCQVMHGDLAARNILLSSVNGGHPRAKIADFGLAKSFYEYVDYQEISSSVPVPWRWMAYEVLAVDVKLCSLKSDVWSFGVLLWEIFSMGKQPYPEFLKLNKAFLRSLKNGEFLTCPEEVEKIKSWCPSSLFDDVSKLCFQIESSKRGSFSEITQIIESYLN